MNTCLFRFRWFGGLIGAGKIADGLKDKKTEVYFHRRRCAAKRESV